MFCETLCLFVTCKTITCEWNTMGYVTNSRMMIKSQWVKLQVWTINYYNLNRSCRSLSVSVHSLLVVYKFFVRSHFMSACRGYAQNFSWQARARPRPRRYSSQDVCWKPLGLSTTKLWSLLYIVDIWLTFVDVIVRRHEHNYSTSDTLGYHDPPPIYIVQ